MIAQPCGNCGRPAVGQKFCCSDCEAQSLLHWDAEQKNKPCRCRACQAKPTHSEGTEERGNDESS